MRLLPLLILSAGVARAIIASDESHAARRLYLQHNLSEAEANAKALVAAHPAEPDALAFLATVRLARGDADGALEAAEKSVQLAPANAEFRRQLGDAYALAAIKAGIFSKIGWANKCRTAFEKSVEMDPSSVNARYSLMVYYQQVPGFMGGGMEKAFEQADQIRKRDPARGRIAFAILQIGEKKYADAFTGLNDSLTAAPDDYLALFYLGSLAALSGQHVDRGLDALTTCAGLWPTPGAPRHDAVFWTMGSLFEIKGDMTAARRAYETSIAIDPGYRPSVVALKHLRPPGETATGGSLK